MHIRILEQQMLVDLKKLMFLQAVWKYTQIILRNIKPIQLSQRLTWLATEQLSGKDTIDQVDLARSYAAARSVQHERAIGDQVDLVASCPQIRRW